MAKTRYFVLCGALLAGSAAYAQLKVDVTLVDVVATVTDDRGRYVADLEAEDFILEEDGKLQTIARVEQSDNLPVSVGIVLDVSGSMENKIRTATAAVDRFVRTIHKDDDIFLMTFASTTNLRQDFTSDRTRLSRALKGIELGSGTALYDALDEGLVHMRRGKHNKKAILLVTDGVDSGPGSGSRHNSEKNVLEDIRRSEMMVYCLGIAPTSSGPLSGRSPGGTSTGRPGTGTTIPGIPGSQRGPSITLPGGISIPFPGGRFLSSSFAQRGGVGFPGAQTVDAIDMQVLDAFADASGGRAWLVSGSSNVDRRDDSLDRIFDQIAAELRSQYTLGYYPQRPVNDGKWHRVEVRTKDSEFHVRARKDYFDGQQAERPATR